MIKSYSELIKLKTFEDRFEYLKLDGHIGQETFGFDRYINQILYHSDEWHNARNYVILRDKGCDLGIQDREIFGRIIIHHINPLTEEDILNNTIFVLNPEYLICTSINTHNGIHYGSSTFLDGPMIERSLNDTSPWLL